MKIGDHLFGVAASHVIQQHFIDHQANKEMYLFIQNVGFNLEVIDLATDVDIVTFRLDEKTLRRRGLESFIYRTQDWPPPPAQEGSGAVFAGYPGGSQGIEADGGIVINQMSNRLLLKRVTEKNVVVRAEAKFLRNIDDYPIPDVDMDVGGYSGAPLLTESETIYPPLHVGGVISEGRLFDSDDGRFVDIAAEPIRRIRADGRIARGVI